MLKNLIERFKEWWYWFRHPNELYQVNVMDEKSEIRQYLQSDKAKEELGSNYEEILNDFNNL